jgi:hypothetical protein
LPTIYSAFSRREIEIALLDARAGSPPTAAELLRRYCRCSTNDGLDRIFAAWERWSAEVLESHLSYPVLSFFRSQHNNQSWLAALTTILDATALVLVGIDGMPSEQAKMTFAMARHAAVDLSQVVAATYDPHFSDRLSGDVRALRARHRPPFANRTTAVDARQEDARQLEGGPVGRSHCEPFGWGDRCVSQRRPFLDQDRRP